MAAPASTLASLLSLVPAAPRRVAVCSPVHSIRAEAVMPLSARGMPRRRGGPAVLMGRLVRAPTPRNCVRACMPLPVCRVPHHRRVLAVLVRALMHMRAPDVRAGAVMLGSAAAVEPRLRLLAAAALARLGPLRGRVVQRAR